MKQMKSLLEDPHGFSVSLVFDGILVGIFAGCISVIYRLLLNNAEKLLFAIIALQKQDLSGLQSGLSLSLSWD